MDQAGDYEITADNGRGQESHLSVTAEASSEEFYDVQSDPVLLTRVARESGGELVSAEKAGPLGHFGL